MSMPCCVTALCRIQRPVSDAEADLRHVGMPQARAQQRAAGIGGSGRGRQRFYLVGSDASEQVHRVLKIDRTTPGHELLLIEDEAVYSSKQVSVALTVADGAGVPHRRA